MFRIVFSGQSIDTLRGLAIDFYNDSGSIPNKFGIAKHDETRITWLQNELNKLVRPSPNLIVDGVFGPKTETAVRLFQAQNGLPVNGVVGTETLAKLSNTQPTTTSKLEKQIPQLESMMMSISTSFNYSLRLSEIEEALTRTREKRESSRKEAMRSHLSSAPRIFEGADQQRSAATLALASGVVSSAISITSGLNAAARLSKVNRKSTQRPIPARDEMQPQQQQLKDELKNSMVEAMTASINFMRALQEREQESDRTRVTRN